MRHVLATRRLPSVYLFSYRGLIHCRVCGSYAKRKIVNLAEKCIGFRTEHGKRVLEALDDGRKPPGVSEWPEDSRTFSAFREGPRPSRGLSANEQRIVVGVQTQIDQILDQLPQLNADRESFVSENDGNFLALQDSSIADDLSDIAKEAEDVCSDLSSD